QTPHGGHYVRWQTACPRASEASGRERKSAAGGETQRACARAGANESRPRGAKHSERRSHAVDRLILLEVLRLQVLPLAGPAGSAPRSRAEHLQLDDLLARLGEGNLQPVGVEHPEPNL